MKVTKKISLLALALICVVAGPVGAQEVSPAGAGELEKAWSATLTPYLWVANLNGTAGIGGNKAPINVPITNILTHLKGLAMVDMTIHYRRFELIADGVWFRLDGSQPLSKPSIGGMPLFSRAAINLSATLGTGALSYRFYPMPGLTIIPTLAPGGGECIPS